MKLRSPVLPGYVHPLLAGAMIFAAGALNSLPAIFPDTAHYYSQGEWLASALGLVSDVRPAWRDGDVTSLMPGSPAMADRLPLTIAGARSPIYGLLLFMTHSLGGLRLLSAIQALVAAWTLYVFSKALLPQPSAGRFWLVTVGVLTGGSLGFFANFAMPDLFSGIALAAAAVLLIAPERLSRFERIGVWALLAFALSCHKTNLVTFAPLLIVGALLLRTLRVPREVAAKRLAGAAVAGVAAVSLGWGASTWYRLDTGMAQSSPPFLTARVMADGMGSAYLKKACAAGADYELCRFQDARFGSEDAFLWAVNPRVGVFSATDYQTRLRLKEEELRFVLAVVRDAPGETVRMAVGHWATQLNAFYVNDPLRPPGWFLNSKWRGDSPFVLLPEAERCRAEPDACLARIAIVPLARWHQFTLMLSLIGAAWALSRADVRRVFRSDADEADLRRQKLLAATVLVTAGVVINAAVCGALSGVFPRYQARVVWLIPSWARAAAPARAVPA
jgi:hypothetical protein